MQRLKSPWKYELTLIRRFSEISKISLPIGVRASRLGTKGSKRNAICTLQFASTRLNIWVQCPELSTSNATYLYTREWRFCRLSAVDFAIEILAWSTKANQRPTPYPPNHPNHLMSEAERQRGESPCLNQKYERDLYFFYAFRPFYRW